MKMATDNTTSRTGASPRKDGERTAEQMEFYRESDEALIAKIHECLSGDGADAAVTGGDDKPNTGRNAAMTLQNGHIESASDGFASVLVTTREGVFTLKTGYIKRIQGGTPHITKVLYETPDGREIPFRSGAFNDGEINALQKVLLKYGEKVPVFVSPYVKTDMLYHCGIDKETGYYVILTGYAPHSGCYIGTPIEFELRQPVHYLPFLRMDGDARPYMFVRDTEGFLPLLDAIRAGDAAAAALMDSMDMSETGVGNVYVDIYGHICVIIGYDREKSLYIRYDMFTNKFETLKPTSSADGLFPLFKEAGVSLRASDGKRRRGKRLYSARIHTSTDNSGEEEDGTNVNDALTVTMDVLAGYDAIMDKYLRKSVRITSKYCVGRAHATEMMWAVPDKELKEYNIRCQHKIPSVNVLKEIIRDDMYGDDSHTARRAQKWYDSVDDKKRSLATRMSERYCASVKCDNTSRKMLFNAAISSIFFKRIFGEIYGAELLRMFERRQDELHIRYVFLFGHDIEEKAGIMRKTLKIIRQMGGKQRQKITAGQEG